MVVVVAATAAVRLAATPRLAAATATKPGRDDAVSAGRGFLLIAGAKAWFMVTSAVVSLGLPRMLGDPALFGDFKVVYSLVSVLNMVLIIGTIQTLSKLVSESPGSARALRRMAVRLQLCVGITLAVVVGVFAEDITGFVFNDAGLGKYLRVGVLVSAIYAVYGIFVGTLNGLERFGDQARLDVVFSTLKVILVAGLVLAGFGVIGAFMGFVGAATAALLTGVYLVSRAAPPESGEPPSMDRFVRLLLPLLATTFMTNMVLQLDVLAVKALVRGVDSDSASRLAGLFGGAKNVSLLPYQATFALTLVVFPMLSRATFSEDRDKAKAYVRQAMRFTLLVAGAACVPLVATAGPLLTILLGAPYAASSTALSILVPTTVLTAMLVLSVTILNAAGNERTALVLTTATVATNALLLWLLLDGVQDERVLTRAAIASAGAAGVGAALAGFAVHRRLGALAPPGTVFRVFGVGGAILLAAQFWPVTGLVSLVAKAVVCGLAFILALLATGEVNQADRAALKRILGRK
ncbi:MAG: O-antigen/teichoic acid export membrane protein [Myxococcota bacterium]